MFRYIEGQKKKKHYKIPVQMPACPPGERDMDNFTHDGRIRKGQQAGGRGVAVDEYRGQNRKGKKKGGKG